jgi:phage-related protein
MVNAAWAQIVSYWNIALNFIKSIVTSVMSEVSSFIGDILGDIKSFWNENGAAIMAIVNAYFTVIKAYITVVMAEIKAVFQIAWPIIVGVIKVAWALIQSIVSTAIKAVLGFISVTMKLLQGDWKGAWETIKSTAHSIWTSIVGYFKNIDLRQVGRNIIQGLVNGISSMIGTVKSKVAEIANLIPDGVKKFLGIHSPSRVLMELGGYTGEGFAIGLGDQLAQIKAASNDMATAAIPKVPTRSVDYTVQNTPTQKPESTPRTYSVEIPLVVDGREIARATVNDLDSLFAGKTRMDFRTQGGKR